MVHNRPSTWWIWQLTLTLGKVFCVLVLSLGNIISRAWFVFCTFCWIYFKQCLWFTCVWKLESIGNKIIPRSPPHSLILKKCVYGKSETDSIFDFQMLTLGLIRIHDLAANAWPYRYYMTCLCTQFFNATCKGVFAKTYGFNANTRPFSKKSAHPCCFEHIDPSHFIQVGGSDD